MYKLSKKNYSKNLRGICRRYKREYKNVGCNFEFAKRSKKTKLVLKHYDSDNDEENGNGVEFFNELEEKAFRFFQKLF